MKQCQWSSIQNPEETGLPPGWIVLGTVNKKQNQEKNPQITISEESTVDDLNKKWKNKVIGLHDGVTWEYYACGRDMSGEDEWYIKAKIIDIILNENKEVVITLKTKSKITWFVIDIDMVCMGDHIPKYDNAPNIWKNNEDGTYNVTYEYHNVIYADCCIANGMVRPKYSF